MPKATILTQGAPRSAGGVERFSASLALCLESAGWDVDVVYPQKACGKWSYRLGLRYLSDARNVTSNMAALNSADLVVSNGFLAPFGRQFRARRIHVYHGCSIPHARAASKGQPRRVTSRHALGGGVTEALAGRGATVVAVSDSVANDVRRYARINTIRVIANGVDTQLFKPGDSRRAREMLGIRSDARIALFVGRLEPGKGAELLVPSCSRTDYELAVAGRTAPDAGIYLGKLSPEKMAVAYAAADCVLFPTRYEGCSYVVLEALASGVPLITTDVGWMSTFLEHVPTYRSLVVRPEVSDVSRMLHALATSNTDEIVASAREYVIANNSYECFSRAWLALVEEVMNSSN